ncbi:BatA domain-containing protein [Schlesneria sp. T3-172]|uniref:BatA domain-containing protein n=1 Tax=Schlesneria sphaerica TaxID=3373610 RepID=UPI0037C6F8BA
MLNFFLNPWMLVGLAGVLLPVIAHLLSRKKYDVVDWGAMQFLELDPSAKRKIRLEELLLLMLRMGLIALVALAFARPWIGSGWLMGLAAVESRDIVLIVDQSYSLGWESDGNGQSIHSRAIQMGREILQGLTPGDVVQIIEAREQPLVLLPHSTRDHYLAKEALNDLLPPSGTADLVAAIQKGIQLLAASSNLRREIIILTDLQARGWNSADTGLWARLDDSLHQSSIAPRIWIVDAAAGEEITAANFTIERLQLLREVAFVNSPINVTTKVRYTGGEGPVTRQVHLEIDGVRVDEKTIQVKLQPGGEMTVDFEHRFETVGSHVLSLVLDHDPLPGDNRAEAVVSVREAIPVLLVDGDRQPDPTRCETYFAQAAFLAGGAEHPWIIPTVIGAEELTIDRVKPFGIVILANVPILDEAMVEGLKKFVASGHTVLVTLGDRVHREDYRTTLYDAGLGLLPCRIESIANEAEQQKRGVRIQNSRLDLPWLKPFRAERGGTLADARWSHWWQVTLPAAPLILQGSPDAPVPSDQPQPDEGEAPDSAETPNVGTSITELSLTTGDPLLVTRRYGRGTAALLTSSLDADWNTLPAKQDYVPFLHELLFSLLSQSEGRNVNVGTPLILNIPAGLNVDEYEFRNPADKVAPFDKLTDPFQTATRLRNPVVPGVYRFLRKVPKPQEQSLSEEFVVNVDRLESTLTRLTADERDTLSGDDRMKFVASVPELRKQLLSDAARAEIWWLILYVFVASLGIETWLTRRMIRPL